MVVPNLNYSMSGTKTELTYPPTVNGCINYTPHIDPRLTSYSVPPAQIESQVCQNQLKIMLRKRLPKPARDAYLIVHVLGIYGLLTSSQILYILCKFSKDH